MKRAHTKLWACCISAGLVAAALTGCGAGDTEPVAGTQTETQTQESTEAAEPAQTEAAESDTEAAAEAPADSGESGAIYVEPIEGISDDFIRGMDASSVLVEEKSGVKYYNFAGEEQDVFQTLAEGGVNYIRLRVWSDPYDENGNGYGGGK